MVERDIYQGICMKPKKIILIVLLLFAVFAMGFIVYSTKTKKGLFGKLYAMNIENRIIDMVYSIRSNINEVGLVSKTVSEGAITRQVYWSHALGENTGTYLVGFAKVKNSIEYSEKIQLINENGELIFSTMGEEILAQQVKSQFMERFSGHFQTNSDPYIYFINEQEMMSVSPRYASTESSNIVGYVLIYYENDVITDGIDDEEIDVAFSVDDFMLLTKNQDLERSEIGKMISLSLIHI